MGDENNTGNLTRETMYRAELVPTGGGKNGGDPQYANNPGLVYRQPGGGGGYTVVEQPPMGRSGPGFYGSRPAARDGSCGVTAAPQGLPNWANASGPALINNPRGIYEGVAVNPNKQCSWQDLHLRACETNDAEPIAYITCGAEITDGDFLEGLRNKGITRKLIARALEYTPQQLVVTGNPIPGGFRSVTPPPGGKNTALLGVTFELTIPPINFNATLVSLYLGQADGLAGMPIALEAMNNDATGPANAIQVPRFVQVRMLEPRARITILTAVRRGSGMTLPQHVLGAFPTFEGEPSPLTCDIVGLPPQGQAQTQLITNNTIALAELASLVEV